MTEVYFSLGSNVGDRQAFMRNAVSHLEDKVKSLTISSFYETEPWGNTDQPKFLNLCAKGITALSAEELLVFIKTIEASLGRKHTEKWGPREIDIDILFYGNKIISDQDVEIPHPYIAHRAFVLEPLAEIAPDFIHPVLKKTIKELADNIDVSGIKKVYEDA